MFSYSEKKNIRNFNMEELERFLLPAGKQRYRARQLFKWMYSKSENSFELMTDLPKAFRKWLDENASIIELKPIQTLLANDNTKKYLFKLADGNAIESVLIPDGYRNTLCISSQVGCRYGCKFCMTGKIGFKRNLETQEIIGQVMYSIHDIGKEKLTNIVFMGMGEPLDNYENVVRTIKILTQREGLSFAGKRITLSTCGLADMIVELSKDVDISLSVSINAADEETRSKIMPVNKIYPISKLLEVIRSRHSKKRKKVTMEYVLLGGINDSEKDANRLAKLLSKIPSKVNLIPYNAVSGSEYYQPDRRTVNKFREVLLKYDIITITRESRGLDICGACGQLTAGYLQTVQLLE
jgi:23S rRNA (adenine2503-C2)-methyltransferase